MKHAFALSVLLLAACGDAPAPKASDDIPEETQDAMIEDLRAQLDEARDRAQEAEAAATTMSDAIDDIRHEAARFRYDDWQDVVPDVERAIDEAESTGDGVTSAISEVTSVLDN